MPGPIPPGAMLGVLGGGQLGAMFSAAARQLGYRVAVWDPDFQAPAHKTADCSFSAPFADCDELERFTNTVSAVTFEWENIPVAVASGLERSVPVRPGSAVLRVLQNRLDHKSFLAQQGFPVAPFRAVPNPNELAKAAEAIGFPCLCKTATAGYDGKGQWRLSSMSEAVSLQEQLSRSAPPHSRWIIEQLLRFTKELSVLVVRGLDGEQRLYPVADNVHEAGILRTTSIPAAINGEVAEQAQKMAASAIHALEGVGVFCVELFLMPDGTLLINEIAPRPHNSAHYTLDACTISQFEQHVRAVCGLPLGEVRLLSPAVMINLIGEDLSRALSEDALMSLLRVPGSKVHVYGKASIRPGRKMGHVTFLAEKPEEARKAALNLERSLRSSTT
ncbi:5-(carboxyamino)imidazole ribonucleotide synthase [Nitrospira sp. Nam74]